MATIVMKKRRVWHAPTFPRRRVGWLHLAVIDVLRGNLGCADYVLTRIASKAANTLEEWAAFNSQRE